MSDHLLFAGHEPRVGIADTRQLGTPAADGALRLNSSAIRIEAVPGARLADLQEAWRDLCARADAANIFMNPVLVAIAGRAYGERKCLALLAWDHTAPVARLMGVWAFAIGRAPYSPLPTEMLCSPAMPNAYLSTPVVDRSALDAVLAAMLEHIARDAHLPKIVALDAMGSDTATMRALERLLEARGAAPCVFSRSQRPHLSSTLDGKAYLEQAFSGPSRKKLRQRRRRLAEKGALTSTVITEPAAVRAAVDDFLTLEASGWKGRERTALLCSGADADYVRAMIGALAAQGEAAIHTLALDGRAVSMQIVLRSGTSAFTWKTAYDESLHDLSPGTLLLEDYTTALLADPQVADVDSCSLDDSGYMGIWRERAEITHLWFDSRPGGSLSFLILSRLQAAYLRLRSRAKALYHDFKRQQPAKK